MDIFLYQTIILYLFIFGNKDGVFTVREQLFIQEKQLIYDNTSVSEVHSNVLVAHYQSSGLFVPKFNFAVVCSKAVVLAS
jgi:hypothetical protein